jgi:hypothetical protein
MKIGNITGSIDSLWQVEYDSGELGSGTTSITISDLDGNTAEEYILIYRIIGGTTTPTVSQYELTFNNDTSSNYGVQWFFATSSTVTATRNTSIDHIPLSNTSSDNTKRVFGIIPIYAKSGDERTATLIFEDGVTTTTVNRVNAQGASWNNTADNITSMEITATQSNGIGTGSRIILLKKVNETSSMQTGDLEVQSDAKIDNAWEKIYENTLSSAASSVTISNLTGNTDILYKLIIRGISAEDTNYFRVRINNDSGTNYGYQTLLGINTTYSAARNTANAIWGIANTVDTDDISMGEFLIYAKSGYERTILSKTLSNISGTTINRAGIWGEVWNNTSNEITSLVISALVASGLNSGTHIELWRLNL